MKAAFLIVALLPLALWACHDGVPNCDNVDSGSCGNACCKWGFIYKELPSNIKDDIIKTVALGGPDNQYALQTTAAAMFGFTDLREDNITNPETGFTDLFIGQAVHTTGPLGVECVFQDYVNFLISLDQNGNTYLTAFSISQVAGAWGDAGQNYYNIITVINAMSYQPVDRQPLLGCPAPQ